MKPAARVAICPACGKVVLGSSIALAHGLPMTAVFLIHHIDEHWELLEAIRATRGNPEGRIQLVRELRPEMLP